MNIKNELAILAGEKIQNYYLKSALNRIARRLYFLVNLITVIKLPSDRIYCDTGPMVLWHDLGLQFTKVSWF